MKFRMVHENYNVVDLDKSLAFYEKALGLYKQEQVLGFVGYTLLNLMFCCAQLGDKDGLETYISELEQILPSLPEHAQEKILMFFQE